MTYMLLHGCMPGYYLVARLTTTWCMTGYGMLYDRLLSGGARRATAHTAHTHRHDARTHSTRTPARTRTYVAHTHTHTHDTHKTHTRRTYGAHPTHTRCKAHGARHTHMTHAHGAHTALFQPHTHTHQIHKPISTPSTSTCTHLPPKG